MYYHSVEFKARLIAMTVVSIIYFSIRFPILSILIYILIIASYFALKNAFTFHSRKIVLDKDRVLRRKEALRIASAFLARYDNIWGGLRLSNNYCALSLGADGQTIRAVEKPNGADSYRTFRVLGSKVHSVEDLWNMFCKHFGHNKTYDGLKEDCYLYRLIIEEHVLTNTEKKQQQFALPAQAQIQVTDINNCNEDELTNLPGVSKIMAKKVVKRRAEIQGFKSVEEFFEYIKLSSSMQENLKKMIVIREIEIVKGPEIFEERNLDL